MNERPRTLMNGRESAVGTYWAYQARGARSTRTADKLRFKKKELWIFHQMLWKTRWTRKSAEPYSRTAECTHCLSREAGEGRDAGVDQAGDSTWMTRLAIMSRVFAP